MMCTMKRIYHKPETQICIDLCSQMLASSYISVGGTGGFDVKEDTRSEEWGDIWQENEEMK